MADKDKNKNKPGAATTPDNGGDASALGPNPEAGVVLSAEDMKSIQEMFKQNQQSQKLIQELTEKVEDLSKVQATAASAEPKASKTKKPKNPIVRLRRFSTADVDLIQHEGKLIVGWEKRGTRSVYQERNPQNMAELIEYIDLRLEGVKDPVKVRYLDFLNLCPQQSFEAVARLVNTETKEYGEVEANTFDEKEGIMKGTGRYVPLEVVTQKYEYDVTVVDEDGRSRVVKLPAEFINA